MVYVVGDKDKRRTGLEAALTKLQRFSEAVNVAEIVDEENLKALGSVVARDYETDKNSRSDWEQSAGRAMDVALQVRKPKSYPFEQAANIKYPLVTVAALQFGARAYPAIVDGNRIVKTQVLGEDESGEKRAKADRVSQHMSWQLLHQMEEWEEDTDVLLHHLPIIGCTFRKVWRSQERRRNVSEMIPAMHLVVNNRVRSLTEAPRVTHEVFLYQQEIEDRRRSGTFLDIDLPSPADGGGDDDAPHMFLEQHRLVDLDGDGYREPYIVTVHKDSCQVVRIAANYEMGRIDHDGRRITRIPKDQYFVKYPFIPDPKGGFYDIGFGKLLESLSETIDTTINQMLDAGHLQNAGGGFVGSGIRLKKGELRMSPGKYFTVDAPGSVLKDSIWSFQHPGPSPVLFQLLGMMVEAARDITAVKDIMTGDSGERGVQTATATLAMIEQGLKVFTAIYKRVYRSLKDEMSLLFRLNARYMNEKEYFQFLDSPAAAMRSDYNVESMDIMPVADPRMVTDMQRAAMANVLMQIQAHPVFGMLQNPEEALRRIYDSVGMQDMAKLIVQPQGPDPMAQAAAVAEIKDMEAGAAQKAATADKTQAETEVMRAEHDAALFGRQLESMVAGTTAEEAA